jgi:membrane protein
MKKWLKRSFNITKFSVLEFFDDSGFSVAAAIAFYTFQSFIPLVLVIIIIASFLLQTESPVRQNVIKGIQTFLPPASGIDVGNLIDNIAKSAPGLLSITTLFLLWSGTNIFDQLIFGVNTAYDVKNDTRNIGVKLGMRFGFFLFLGLLVTLGYALSIVLDLIFQANLSLFGVTPQDLFFLLPFALNLIPVLLIFLVFTILYKYAPDRKGVRWRDVVAGALVAAILFEILKRGFTFYLNFFNAKDSYTQTYGYLGGVLLFLFYLWLNSVVMLFGAEVASVMGGWKSVGEKVDETANNAATAEKAHSEAEHLKQSEGEELVSKRKGKQKGHARTDPSQPKIYPACKAGSENHKNQHLPES